MTESTVPKETVERIKTETSISIDLGASYSGFALRYRGAESIFKHKYYIPIEGENVQYCKNKTCITYKKNIKVTDRVEYIYDDWGWDAYQSYKNGDAVLFFDGFKGALIDGHTEEVRCSNPNMSDIVLPRRRLFVDFLKKLIEQACCFYQNINEGNTTMIAKNEVLSDYNYLDIRDKIHWVFTVPSIYKEIDIVRYKDYIIKALMHTDENIEYYLDWFDEHCTILTEAESAAIGLLNKFEKGDGGSLKPRYTLKCGDQYLVVDVGGKTTDMTYYKVSRGKDTEVRKVKQIYHEKSVDYGAMILDQKILDKLKQKYKLDDIPENIKTFILAKWEAHKRNLFKKIENYHDGDSVMDFLDDESDTDDSFDLENYLRDTQNQQRMTTNEEGNIVFITTDEQNIIDSNMELSFEEVKAEVTQFADELSTIIKSYMFTVPSRRSLSYVFVVGGISSMSHILEVVTDSLEKDKFSRKKIKGSDDPGACVIDGAATVGLFPDIVDERLSGFHYGVKVTKPYTKNNFPNMDDILQLDPTGSTVLNGFEVLLQKGAPLTGFGVSKIYRIPLLSETITIEYWRYKADTFPPPIITNEAGDEDGIFDRVGTYEIDITDRTANHIILKFKIRDGTYVDFSAYFCEGGEEVGDRLPFINKDRRRILEVDELNKYGEAEDKYYESQ